MLAGPAEAQGGAIGGTGSQYYLNDALSGNANRVFVYGDAGDAVYFGDWDGNGTDTPLIRRGNTFYVRNSNSSGPADAVFSYGDAGDVILTGDWDGNRSDTLAVRRGGTYYIKNSISTGNADAVFGYGNPGDTVFVGDWDGNGSDTLGVRRPLNPGDDRDCKNFASQRDAQAYFDYYYPYYGDVSRLDRDNDRIACELNGG